MLRVCCRTADCGIVFCGQGTGGDNSNRAQGNFYEGMMVTGATTDATDDAVQANVVAVGYKAFDASDEPSRT